MKVRVGVEGIAFDSAHYTLSSEGNDQLHGHTYKLSVTVEGNGIDPDTGFVVDFGILKKIVLEVIKEWDHKLIIPKRDVEKVSIKGPFKLETKTIEGNYPTVEYIGFEIAKEIYDRLGGKYSIEIKIYEGEASYVIINYP
ncbi:6-pyruvoyl trahydropterin synthase family protein [Stygiolobus caldivivus]|uniref:6-pyruvoyl tetrahydrobiopterin synthase n=1 Tax=Stygiolobus caldivivus TaxID=2824673 RepID=A0A8D5U636_9CREN|nr:6-carboxytetrahydropterin synthase [Stygiolobus caldivivus]BCU69534.1 6-pyruvoyl tetrahydrobiopterin synthase [Stygiolobus caldivivus]